MTSIASKRIKGGRGPSGNGRPGEEYKDYFRTAVILSVVIHAAIFGIFWLESGRKAFKKVEMFTVTVTTLPGPQGGGGHSREIVKNPVKEKKPAPKEETVKIAKKETEKKPPEKKKPLPEKPEAAKVQHQAPQGPGQGPVGGGGKIKPNAIIGPMAFAGNFDSRYAWYAQIIQRAVERAWKERVPWDVPARPAVISFVIDSGGNLTQVQIESSSGIGYYDQEALISVKMVRKLQPLPAGLGDALGVRYSFIPKKQG